MGRMGRNGLTRRCAVAVGSALVVAACSGGGDDGGSGDSSPTSAAASTTVSTTTSPPEPVGADPTPDDAPESTTTSTTTTTEPPVVELAVGAIWRGSDVADVRGAASALQQLVVVGDEVWIVGARANAPAIWRSGDGVGWTETLLAPPVSGTAVLVSGVVPRGDGYLAWAQSTTSCSGSTDVGDGFTELNFCDIRRIALYVSDDGASWRQIEPPAMQIGGDASSRIDDLTVVDDGYVAVGTIARPDWHSRVWFSPDGENWELVTELRGADGPMSGHEVHWDGTNLTVMTHEHPCSQNSINFNSPGWILGTAWADHIRMFSGSDVRAIAPVDPATSPLLEPPLTIDCSTTSELEVDQLAYPGATGLVIDGALTLFDTRIGLPDDADEADPGSFPYRFFTFDGADWTETVTDGLDRTEQTRFVQIDGAPAFVRWSRNGIGLVDLEVARLDAAGDWTVDASLRPVRGDNLAAAVGFGDAVVVTSTTRRNPFEQITFTTDPRLIVAAVTTAIREDEVDECVPAAGVACELASFEAVDGFPDLAGSDFSGAELAFADLGDGDYSGSTFAGAQMLGATTDFGARMIGVDFSGADLRGADLRDVGGANFADANLSDAEIEFSSLPEFGGAVLVDASLRFDELPDGGFEDVVLSLPGFDLTDAQINGPLLDDTPLLVIGDLTGAILDGTRFRRVDMTGATLDPDVDLSTFTLNVESLCPDGAPPDGEFSGTCDRTAQVEG